MLPEITNRQGLAAFLGFALEADCFLRKWKSPKWVLDRVAYCAAHGYLFAAMERGQIIGVGIAGPCSAALLNAKGASLMPEAFDGGDHLYGAWAVVAAKHRRPGSPVVATLLELARASFPDCTILVYARGLRGDTRLRGMSLSQEPECPLSEDSPGPHRLQLSGNGTT